MAIPKADQEFVDGIHAYEASIEALKRENTQLRDACRAVLRWADAAPDEHDPLALHQAIQRVRAALKGKS